MIRKRRILTDSFNRTIDYLRLSITDRCNLRCLYCLPEHSAHCAQAEAPMTASEILRLVSCFSELGVSWVRLTGGEPLIHEGLTPILSGIAKTPGIKDVSLSTNGVLLQDKVRELTRAGLKRVNISLDSLDPRRFHKATRIGNLSSVLNGIDAALKAGLSPVKINVMVARGINEDEIGDFVRWTENEPLHVRFIELMPMGETGFFSHQRRVPLAEMFERAAPLEELAVDDWPCGPGPARYWRRPGARGTVGFISALSLGFCAACNRVRLSSQGILTPCLDSSDGADLKTPLRAGAGRLRLQSIILRAVAAKPKRHFMLERAEGLPGSRNMCQTGG